jgi:hypothetical protein
MTRKFLMVLSLNINEILLYPEKSYKNDGTDTHCVCNSVRTRNRINNNCTRSFL